MKSFDHLVRIDQETGELSVFRIEADGRQSLYTVTRLPTTVGWTSELEEFAKRLGENLLMDSPVARAMLKL